MNLIYPDVDSCKSLLAGLDVVEKVIEEAKAAEPNPFAATRIISHIENNIGKKAGKRGLVFRPILVTLAVVGAIALGLHDRKKRVFQDQRYC